MLNIPIGRAKILSLYSEIDTDNVVEAFNAALSVHNANKAQISFLYNYFRGETPILGKTKEYRKEINYKVGVATAQEIVSFYTGYIFGDAISYIRHDAETGGEQNVEITRQISDINDWVRLAGKEACDLEIAEWALVCGTSYRACMPELVRAEETPISLYSLDPRDSFVAYNAIDGKTPVFAVNARQYPGQTETSYILYTRDTIYEIKGGAIVGAERNPCGEIPIIEYPANSMRIGVFEPVIPLLNAMEAIQSSRTDAVIQDVDNVLAIIGANLGDDEDDEAKSTLALLQKLKMLILPPGSDAKYITAPLKQADVQTIYDSLYSAVLTITGLPNRNGGSSTSDTGQAVYLRDGFASAESRAKKLEGSFRAAEISFLRVAIAIARLQQQSVARVKDIEIKFPRRYSENVLVRVQALKNLVDMGFAPEDALAMVSLVSDPLDVAIRNRDRIDRILFRDIAPVGATTPAPEEE